MENASKDAVPFAESEAEEFSSEDEVAEECIDACTTPAPSAVGTTSLSNATGARVQGTGSKTVPFRL